VSVRRVVSLVPSLTEEMAGFAEEYMRLVDRYGALQMTRDGAGPREKRRMLVRYYAFPRDLVEEDTTDAGLFQGTSSRSA
jgi:hypothetical protein